VEEDRYTFSMVMNFLIELEDKIANFYKEAAERVRQDGLKELFLSFNRRNLERRDTIDRVKRETVLEMTLEPITGLRLENYIQRIDDIIRNEKAADPIDKSLRMEEIVYRLYNEVSVKVMYMSAGTSEMLKTLSKENANRRNKLEDLKNEPQYSSSAYPPP
jgi:rubrerythrin